MEVIRVDQTEYRELATTMDSAPCEGDKAQVVELRTTYQAEQARIVITHMPPRHRQEMHHHEILYDATYVVHGKVLAFEETAAGSEVVTLGEGDVVVFGPGPSHTLQNATYEEATILTIKFIHQPELSRESFALLCASDRYADPAD